jgi:hypothetical protein
MAQTVLNLPRELARHSGKASSSARDLALEEGRFPVRSISGSSSASVALGETFPECIWHLGKPASPIVLARGVLLL